jgi:LCP family protein required for cell wall assembly
VYRSHKRLRDRLAPAAGSPLDALRRRRGGKGAPGEPEPKGGVTPRRVLKWLALAIFGWIIVAIVVFFISAQTAPSVSQKTKDALSSGGTLLTGSNVLVLGSDQRPKGSKEPGASTSGPSRSDSIIVMHVGFASVRKLSILRDTRVDIPGHGSDRINAAYAFGGAPLTIKTVEHFLPGVKINHIIEVSFTDFPNLIDALGGVDVTLKNCINSPPFDGKAFHLKKGDHHFNGKEALRFARVRHNTCSKTGANDNERAARQQQVLGAMRDKILSPSNWPSTFIRAPFIAWNAPRALRSDVHGPGLAALFTDLLTGGTGATNVLFDRAQPFNPDKTIHVGPAEAQSAANTLLGK